MCVWFNTCNVLMCSTRPRLHALSSIVPLVPLLSEKGTPGLAFLASSHGLLLCPQGKGECGGAQGVNLRLLDSSHVTISLDETTSIEDVDHLLTVLNGGKPAGFSAESLAESVRPPSRTPARACLTASPRASASGLLVGGSIRLIVPSVDLMKVEVKVWVWHTVFTT